MNTQRSFWRRLASGAAIVSVAAAIGAQLSRLNAGIPQPDAIVWGEIVLDSLPVQASSASVVVEARRSQNGAAFLVYAMGTDLSIGDRYALHLPIEDSAPISSPASSVAGTHIFIAVVDASGTRAVQEVVLGGFGQFLRLDFGESDSDNNGLDDAWEMKYFGRVGVDPNADPDGDGLSNLDEFHAGTNPLAPDNAHPADIGPQDWNLTQDEVYAYAASWKEGTAWPSGPQLGGDSVIHYLTRAAEIWLGGGYYRQVTNAESPVWWVSVPPPLGLPTNRVYPLGSSTNTASLFHSGLPARFFPGQVMTISNSAVVVSTARAYAVQQAVPADWTPTNISDDGEYDSQASVIRWGPYFDNQSRAFSFQIIAPASPTNAAAAVLFPVTLSVDGAAAPVDGRTFTTDAGPALSIQSTPDGLLLGVEGLPNSLLSIEASADLSQWYPLMSIQTGPDGAGGSTLASDAVVQFFRVRLQ